MMIARADNEDGEMLLLLGLSNENLRRLVMGQPMNISRATHGDGIPEKWRIVIMYGKTEQDMQRDLGDMIGPDTKIHRDPRL